MSKSVAPEPLANRHLYAKIFGALIVLFPAAALAIQRGGNTIMFLTVALGAVILMTARQRGEVCSLIKTNRPVRVFVLSLCLPFFAVLIVETLHGKVVANTLDSPVRFLLAAIVFFGLRRIVDVMPAMAAAGTLTPLAADYGKGEVHNQILAYAVDYGLLGVLCILAFSASTLALPISSFAPPSWD
ncbi:hypothetical protein [Pandoraea sp. B-6]|uniref:hypothetical protein n=1 Tax=Pandoraea sp. B-6 TaxID=1204340 RepID=UPI000345C064|nr:hypothetical protein [Pandoraea sp. B-6]